MFRLNTWRLNLDLKFQSLSVRNLNPFFLPISCICFRPTEAIVIFRTLKVAKAQQKMSAFFGTADTSGHPHFTGSPSVDKHSLQSLSFILFLKVFKTLIGFSRIFSKLGLNHVIFNKPGRYKSTDLKFS